MSNNRFSLKAARVYNSMTQIEAARILGVMPSTLSSWETKEKPIKHIFKFAICKVYGMELDDIHWPGEKYNNE